MWFADPTTFNDPFDCRLSETHSHTRGDVEDYVTSQGLSGQEEAAILDLFDRDPAHIRDISVRARDGVIKKRGILSLSKINDNILMWSHYAQSHEGLALGFDISKDMDFFSIPLKVDYQAEYVELNYFRDRADTIKRNLSTKAQCWKYEEELRVMKDAVGLVSFDPACLIDIYFGCAASPDFVTEVRTACASGRLSHVRFHQGRVRPGEFALDFDAL
ncbi:DUF2971 domain-containing protein [Pseudoxanthomonas sacheonensis]|uniref:DUF2971 domain-containing protein n=1 Tax=Pseudoxanthomonas sacheonensis TaxID=443615 RepID=A0ABU1RRC3_9GAMM|nr:DUF2971 domain-containing protein [Pseudoxanthomonas sacheonensis]MDR6841322.1 hypothetical protein [Pseudoxanthomonas sacheonensis]